ncbi:uncharacterized protein [Palaemon carinicauda]|uniref:uncharacterized protein n=1 Tax=Palaemon carinicauda TaxID=392227 RepID=UPI0035B5E4A0
MKALVRSLIWYPNIDHDVERLVKNCELCQSVQARPSKNQHVIWPTPPRPWSRVHIDHFFYESHTCLIVVDALSKYIEVEIVHSTNANETIDALRLVFSRNGLCDTLFSDNASCFTNSKFKQFLENNGIIHITPPPYSPSMSLNNRKFVSVKDRINPKYTANKPSCEFKQIAKFEVGDKVLALNLRDGPKWFQGEIVQKLGVNVYNVHVQELDVIWKRHCNQLLSIIGSEPKNSISNESSCVSSYSELPSQQQVVQPYVSVEFPSNVSPHHNISVPAIGVSGDIPVTDVIPIRRSTRNRKPEIHYGYDEYWRCYGVLL